MKYFFGRLNVIIIYTWDKRSATNYGPKTTRRNAIWRCTNAYETRARASHPRRSPSIRYCPELNSIDCMFEFVYLWLCLVSMALAFAIHLGRIHVMLVQARARDFEWERDGGGRLCRNEMRSESHSLTHTHTHFTAAPAPTTAAFMNVMKIKSATVHKMNHVFWLDCARLRGTLTATAASISLCIYFTLPLHTFT